MIFWILLGVIVALLAYIRLAPIDAAAIHCDVQAAEDAEGEGHCVRIVQADEAALGRVDAVAMALPRTSRVAGSVAQGHITYATRSRVMGFPDYTTVQRDGGQIKMFARLRFGRSDLGVNRARLEKLVAAAGG